MMGMVTGGADRDITNMCCSRLNSRSNLQSIQMPLSSSSLICAWARVADRLRAGQGRAGQGRAGQGREHSTAQHSTKDPRTGVKKGDLHLRARAIWIIWMVVPPC